MPNTAERRWAVLRIVMGQAQMLCATVTLVLLWRTGVNRVTLAAAVVTCLLTTASVLLFANQRGSKGG